MHSNQERVVGATAEGEPVTLGQVVEAESDVREWLSMNCTSGV